MSQREIYIWGRYRDREIKEERGYRGERHREIER